ncbi:hypothetical protein QOT17_021454 [Balamuthia mandrillaris]
MRNNGMACILRQIEEERKKKERLEWYLNEVVLEKNELLSLESVFEEWERELDVARAMSKPRRVVSLQQELDLKFTISQGQTVQRQRAQPHLATAAPSASSPLPSTELPRHSIATHSILLKTNAAKHVSCGKRKRNESPPLLHSGLDCLLHGHGGNESEGEDDLEATTSTVPPHKRLRESEPQNTNNKLPVSNNNNTNNNVAKTGRPRYHEASSSFLEAKRRLGLADKTKKGQESFEDLLSGREKHRASSSSSSSASSSCSFLATRQFEQQSSHHHEHLHEEDWTQHQAATALLEV